MSIKANILEAGVNFNLHPPCSGPRTFLKLQKILSAPHTLEYNWDQKSAEIRDLSLLKRTKSETSSAALSQSGRHLRFRHLIKAWFISYVKSKLLAETVEEQQKVCTG